MSDENKYGLIPPLLEEELVALKGFNTHYTGSACVADFQSFFLAQGINIAVPEVDDGTDLLIKYPSWSKAQVKKVVRVKSNGLFSFFFNSTRASGSRRLQGYDVDWFLHCIKTCYRSLLFITPDHAVPRRDDGQQVMAIEIVLDRHNRVHSKKKKLNMVDYLVSATYAPEIYKAFPDFWE